MGAVTTLPLELNFTKRRRVRASAEIMAAPASPRYTGETFYPWPEVAVDRIIFKTGADPSEAELTVPVGKVTAAVGGAFGHKVYVPSTDELAPFAPIHRQFKKGSKVKIYLDPTAGLLVGGQGKKKLLFVGTITKIRVGTQGKARSNMTLTCKDGRWLGRGRNSTQGIVNFNYATSFPTDPTTTQAIPATTEFIRDNATPFNEGTQANMFYDPTTSAWFETPRFIETNYGRFNDTQEFLEDQEVEDLDASSAREFPVARKWLAGCVYNYVANMHDDALTGGISGTPTWWDVPDTVTADDVPTVLSEELKIIRLHPGKINSRNYGADWFGPRALVGAPTESGQSTIISSVGEYSPWGQGPVDILFDLCRRLGNYTLVATYSEEGTGKTVLQVVRTTQIFGFDQDLPVGINPGKEAILIIPGDDSGEIAPDAYQFTVETSLENTYNVFHTKGGPLFIQLTFMTMGLLKGFDWAGQFHPAYAPGNPNVEFNPKVDRATLVAGWSNFMKEEWLKLALVEQKQSEIFPDVYTSYLIPDEIDFVAVIGLGGQIGTRRFFRKDRQVLGNLVSSYFEKILGPYRIRRQPMGLQVYRAFRGIRTDPDGSTRFGGPSTEATDSQSGNGPQNLSDWFLIQPGFRVLDDGRTGVGFEPAARSNDRWEFEAGTTGKSRSPHTWNGVIEDSPNEARSARSYEIMLTVPISSDEDLFEFMALQAGGMNIDKFGFRSERLQDAGNEFGIQKAVNSVVQIKNSGTKVLDPGGGSPQRRYVDGQQELTARNHMAANKFSKPDVDGQINIPSLRLDLQAGQYIKELRELRGDDGNVRKIPVNSLISTLALEFADTQSTTVEFGSVR